MPYDEWRSRDRFITRETGREAHHSFSFGRHYDPANVGFGPLVAHNDENLDRDGGYAEHPHRGVEIVTFVVSGSLQHESEFGSHTLHAGDVQRLRAGSGVRHSEMAHPGPTRFIQTWLTLPDPESRPCYDAWTPTGSSLLAGSGSPVTLEAPARLWALRGSAVLEATWAHLFVIEGLFQVGRHRLHASDALRATDLEALSIHGSGLALAWTD